MKEIGKYEAKDGSVRVLLDEENRMLCDVATSDLVRLIGFKDKNSLAMLMDRNPRVKTSKFSRIELMNTNGGIQETRLFTERGIVEVAFLAGTAKAEKFRDDIYDLLVSLREKNMVSFGANGLDVKLLEQVKESNDRVASIGVETIEEIETLEETLEKMSTMFEVIEGIVGKFEEFEKDREAIKYVSFFQKRLEENEIDIINIKKELKKTNESLNKINKKVDEK